MSTTAEKLTYLNTTKSKIKDSINLTGAGITSSDTFRSYASKLKLGYIDIINNGIDTLYNNFPKVSGIGSNLSLTPTYEAPMKLNEIQGDTLQDGTPTPDSPVEIQSVTGLQNINVTGKNLLKNQGINQTINGITFTKNEDGSITASGTATATAFYNMSEFTLPAGTYNISQGFQGTSGYYLQLVERVSGTPVIANISSRTNRTFTLSEQKNLRVNFRIANGTTIDNLIAFPMIEQGSTETDYEEYKSTTYEVNLGKNLFDKDNANIINCLINGQTGVISSNSNCRTLYIKCNTNTTYTISRTIGARFIIGTSTNIPVAGVACNQFLGNNSASSLTITTRENDNYLCAFYYLNGTDTLTEQEILDSIQIEVGSIASSYSSYFTPIELNKIGDYQDSIKKSSGKNLFDKDNTSSINAYINDSTSKFTNSGTVKTYYIPCKGNTTYTLSKILSNQFRVGTSVNIPAIDGDLLQVWRDNSATTYSITTNSSAKYLCFCIHNSSGATVTEQQVLDSLMINEGSTALPYEPYGKVWYVEKQIGKVVLNGSEGWVAQSIKTNTTAYALSGSIGYKATDSDSDNAFINYFKGNTNGYNVDEECFWFNGNGYLRLRISNTLASTVADLKTWLSTHNTEIYYVLATPTYTEITNTELIEDLETLYTAKSQEGTTNISITSEDLEMILNVSALKGDV